MQKDNLVYVLTRFIKELNIPVTRQSIIDEMEKQPNYNSLLAFSEVLNSWNVSNAGYKLDYEQLVEVPVPFIVYLSKKEFAVVTSLDDKQAILSTEKWNDKSFTIDEFKKLYGSHILVAEKDENSGETDYDNKRRNEQISNIRLPILLIGMALLLLGSLFSNTFFVNGLNLSIALLTLFKTAGLTTTILLLVQSIDANNPLIQRLCGDKNQNCNSILSSKAAKVPIGASVELNWSEVGFFYFAGTWLLLLFNNGHIALLQMLSLLNLLALPYTFYSIYYQWKIAKQWCIFCCTVQALLWLEFFSCLTILHSFQVPNLAEWNSFMICMAAPVLTWMLIKPFLLHAKQLAPLKRQLYRFKYNTELFKKMLNDENQYALPADEQSLIIGNPEAEKIITMVANPYCQPCAKAHKDLQWIESCKDVKLQVIFSASGDEQDRQTAVVSHLLSIKINMNDTLAKKAMHDWYEQKQKNFEDWVNDYPTEKNSFAVEQLRKQREWCEMAEVNRTPTLFINGRRLPINYQPEDLKYII